MARLRLTSRSRTELLSNDETVRLGRVLTQGLGGARVTFPEGTETAVVEVWDCDGAIPEEVGVKVRAVLGAYDVASAPD